MQEPVAWMVTYGGLTRIEYTLPSKVVDTHYQPLYTTPPAAQWDKPAASFNAWWGDSYHIDPANPFAEGSAAYWAWAGWKAAQPDYEFDYKLAFNEWLDKTEWVQEKINSGHLGVRYLGMHRADVLRDLAYPNTVTGKAPQQRPWVRLTPEDLALVLVAIEHYFKERNT
jgi:hypothetical protein